MGYDIWSWRKTPAPLGMHPQASKRRKGSDGEKNQLEQNAEAAGPAARAHLSPVAWEHSQGPDPQDQLQASQPVMEPVSGSLPQVWPPPLLAPTFYSSTYPVS